MSYSIVLGDLGPVFPAVLSDDSGPFVLDATHDTVTLDYTDPAGTTHSVAMTIEVPSAGSIQRTWIAGDLPVPGLYRGMFKITRNDADVTYPRSFPNDGTNVIWWVTGTI